MRKGKINVGDYVKAAMFSEVYRVDTIMPDSKERLQAKLIRADGTCVGWNAVDDLIKVKRFKERKIWVEA